MLKKHFVLSFIVYTAILIFAEFNKIHLVFFVLFPVFLLPFFYAAEEPTHPLSLITICFTGLVYIIYVIRFFSWEMVLLGVIQVLLFFAFYGYTEAWKIKWRREEKTKQISFRDLRAFNHKYRSRLDSLKHLEKQVAGLLELFEIARDFSEYLSFGGIASILQKRVRPHFPFELMKLVIVEAKPSEGTDHVLRFSLGEQDVKQSEDPLETDESDAFSKIRTSKNIIESGKRWIFPLLMDVGFSSFLMVEGAVADDLAKFEVLSAFLTLQIKKIHLYDAVKELAIRDGLTGVFLRRHFLERMEEEVKRSEKYHLPLALLMLDIDHFKRYNDEYGHLAGDATLKQVASVLLKSVRKVDIVARYGGEEFIVLIPETRKEGAVEIAERIRSSVARNSFKIYNTVARMTVSVGVAFFTEETALLMASLDSKEKVFKLIQNADKALYQAKEEGRNQVVLFQGHE